MKINRYVPILRTKRAEFTALKNTSNATKEKFTPLFELRKRTAREIQDGLTLEKYIKPRVIKCIESWGMSDCMLFDAMGIPDDVVLENKQSALEYCFGIFLKNNVSVIPVVTTDRNDSTCRILSTVSDSFCFRFFLDDLELPANTHETLKKQLGILEADSKKCHILIDLKHIVDNRFDELIDAIAAFTAEVNISDWASLTIAGCAFPEDMSGVKKNEKHTIARREWECWNSMKDAAGLIGMLPKFSDYTIINPMKPEVDGIQFKNIANKIRYTLSDQWVVYRGDNPESKDEKYLVYQELSHKLVNTPGYRGANYSWGDGQINECALGEQSICQLEKWIQIDINQHLKFVAEQLCEAF
jgi:hypothetical protein